MNEIFEDQISKSGVSIAIAGSSTEYLRDYPTLEGSHNKNKGLHVFDYEKDYTTYININGSIEDQSKSGDEINEALKSGIPSFGVLTINKDFLKFELITQGHIQMDYLTINLGDNNEDSEGGKIDLIICSYSIIQVHGIPVLSSLNYWVLVLHHQLDQMNVPKTAFRW